MAIGRKSDPGGASLRAWPALAGLAALSLMAACQGLPKLNADAAVLTATAPGVLPEAPDCASCHAYPLHDVNHQYHLISANVNRNNLGQPELNNITTCLDCHMNSIRSFAFQHSDTVWVNANGDTLMQHTEPTDRPARITTWNGWRPLPDTSFGIPEGPQLAERIDSMIFRYARMGKDVRWRTSHAHDNGVVDVAFAPNDVTSPDSLATAYKPRDLSCSAVTCHNTRAATYRFMDPSKGFSNCPSLDGMDPTCNETAAGPVFKRGAF